MTEEIVHLTNHDFQEWLEGRLKKRWEKRGYKNVAVGVPAPHGLDVASNLDDENIVATIIHDEGQFTCHLSYKVWMEAFALAKYKELTK